MNCNGKPVLPTRAFGNPRGIRKKPPPRAEALAEGAILSNTNSPALCRAFFMQDLPVGEGDRYYFDTRVTRVCLLLLERNFTR